MELPSFLNFSFDSREIMTIILIGLPQFQATLKKSIHSPLHSRTLFQFTWEAYDDPAKFRELLVEAFKNPGIHETILSQSGIQLIYLASKGRFRYAHRILTAALQIAANKLLKVTLLNCRYTRSDCSCSFCYAMLRLSQIDLIVTLEIFMSMTIRVDETIYLEARKTAKAECRTIAHQIEYWAKIGKAALDNPDLPIDFIREVLIAHKQDRSLAEPFTPGS